MRRSPLLLVGFALTAVAVTGSAYAAANPFTASSNVAGYGQMTTTGATITDVAYTLGSDASRISAVTFTTSTDVRGATARLQLRQGTSIVGTYPCDTSGVFGTSMTVPCALPVPVALSSFDTTGFAVVEAP